MSAHKVVARLLISVCLLSCILPRTLSAPSPVQFTLTGQVNINSQEQSVPRIIARLYFPKSNNQPPLLTFADNNGYFEFANVPGGDYLIEVYVNGQMIYQQKISLPSGIASNSKLVTLALKSGGGASWTKVWEKSKLEQRHKATMQGNEFQGQVGVYVGDIPAPHTNGTFSVIVFKTGNETSRWQDSSRLDERTLRSMLNRDRIILDDRLSRNKLKTGFSYNGHYYSLDGKLDAHLFGPDYISFEIWRKP